MHIRLTQIIRKLVIPSIGMHVGNVILSYLLKVQPLWRAIWSSNKLSTHMLNYYAARVDMSPTEALACVQWEICTSATELKTVLYVKTRPVGNLNVYR